MVFSPFLTGQTTNDEQNSVNTQQKMSQKPRCSISNGWSAVYLVTSFPPGSSPGRQAGVSAQLHGVKGMRLRALLRGHLGVEIKKRDPLCFHFCHWKVSRGSWRSFGSHCLKAHPLFYWYPKDNEGSEQANWRYSVGNTRPMTTMEQQGKKEE